VLVGLGWWGNTFYVIPGDARRQLNSKNVCNPLVNARGTRNPLLFSGRVACHDVDIDDPAGRELRLLVAQRWWWWLRCLVIG